MYTFKVRQKMKKGKLQYYIRVPVYIDKGQPLHYFETEEEARAFGNKIRQDYYGNPKQKSQDETRKKEKVLMNDEIILDEQMDRLMQIFDVDEYQWFYFIKALESANLEWWSELGFVTDRFDFWKYRSKPSKASTH